MAQARQAKPVKSDRNPGEAFAGEPGRLFPGNTEGLLPGQAGSGCGGCRRALGFGEQRDDSVPVPQGHLRGSLSLWQKP